MQAFPITLELNNIEELLVVHQDNPFQPNFRLMSGIQEIVEILRTTPANQQVNITLVLPAGTTITSEMETHLHTALVQYCDAQIKINRLELETRRRAAWRPFHFGILTLAISLGLAGVIARTEFLADWLRILLTNAVTLFGTVALWSPTEALLFSWYPALKRVRIYEMLKTVKLNFRVGSARQ